MGDRRNLSGLLAGPSRRTPHELYYRVSSKSMGKRELLLIAAFAVVGAIVYQFTAQPPAPGEASFSFGQIIENIRRGVRGNRASAEATTTTTHPVDAAITELRLNLPRGEITIAGEDRDTIEAELYVRSNGFDEAEAQRLVKESVFKVDRAGSSLLTTVDFPQAGSQRARLLLRVPARLRLRLGGTSGPLMVSNVASVELGSSRGETSITRIQGRVSGTQRSGEIAVVDSGSLKLTTVGSDVRLERISGEATLNMRSGELKASEIGGPIDLDTTGTDVQLEKLEKTTGILRITATSGELSVKGLRTEGRIDVRNARVEAVIDRAAPLAIYSEGGSPVELTPPAGGYQLDAVASDSSITLPAGTLQVTSTGQERRATGPVGGGGPTITIRTTRGNITVRSR